MKTEDIINRTIIANRLDSITQEMGISLEHSAHSPIFAEACDFACCICNSNGDLDSQLSGIPILATAGSFSVKSVIKKYKEDIHDGNAFIINDPYDGGNHLPDIGIITPVFNDMNYYFSVLAELIMGILVVQQQVVIIQRLLKFFKKVYVYILLE